jgi:hypothetical protein
MSSKYNDDQGSSKFDNELEEDASEAFEECAQNMAATLADLFNDGSEESESFTMAGNAEQLSIFCRVADWWSEEHGTWFTEFSDQHCDQWDPDTDLADTDDIECKLEWTT